MASLNKSLYSTWLAQQALETIEQNMVANFAALQQMNAGRTMNVAGELQTKFEGTPFWNGLGQRALYLRGYMLIDPSFETSDKPIWANMINEVEEIPSANFSNLFKIIT